MQWVGGTGEERTAAPVRTYVSVPFNGVIIIDLLRGGLAAAVVGCVADPVPAAGALPGDGEVPLAALAGIAHDVRSTPGISHPIP